VVVDRGELDRGKHHAGVCLAAVGHGRCRTTALMLWRNAVLREGSWSSPWRGSLDGMHLVPARATGCGSCQRFARDDASRHWVQHHVAFGG
jgi:hypothetical protein